MSQETSSNDALAAVVLLVQTAVYAHAWNAYRMGRWPINRHHADGALLLTALACVMLTIVMMLANLPEYVLHVVSPFAVLHFVCAVYVRDVTLTSDG